MSRTNKFLKHQTFQLTVKLLLLLLDNLVYSVSLFDKSCIFHLDMNHLRYSTLNIFNHIVYYLIINFLLSFQ